MPRQTATLIALHEPAARTAGKGRQTRQAILDCALQLAGRVGLQGLSIGLVADAIGMSKSGVFAHFGAREELQLSVVRHYRERFEHLVFQPALQQPRGLPRLHLLFTRWVAEVGRELESGCIDISGAIEFDDQPGAVRDALAAMVLAWQQALQRAVTQAVEAGHLRPQTDPEQLVFELQSLVLGLHHAARFLHLPDCLLRVGLAWQRLLDCQLTPAGRRLGPALAQLPGCSSHFGDPR